MVAQGGSAAGWLGGDGDGDGDQVEEDVTLNIFLKEPWQSCIIFGSITRLGVFWVFGQRGAGGFGRNRSILFSQATRYLFFLLPLPAFLVDRRMDVLLGNAAVDN